MISASISDTISVIITIMATSPKKLPTSPASNSNVAKEIIVVMMAETMAGNTSSVPSTAESAADFPLS